MTNTTKKALGLAGVAGIALIACIGAAIARARERTALCGSEETKDAQTQGEETKSESEEDDAPRAQDAPVSAESERSEESSFLQWIAQHPTEEYGILEDGSFAAGADFSDIFYDWLHITKYVNTEAFCEWLTKIYTDAWKTQCGGLSLESVMRVLYRAIKRSVQHRPTITHTCFYIAEKLKLKTTEEDTARSIAENVLNFLSITGVIRDNDRKNERHARYYGSKFSLELEEETWKAFLAKKKRHANTAKTDDGKEG